MIKLFYINISMIIVSCYRKHLQSLQDDYCPTQINNWLTKKVSSSVKLLIFNNIGGEAEWDCLLWPRLPPLYDPTSSHLDSPTPLDVSQHHRQCGNNPRHNGHEKLVSFFFCRSLFLLLMCGNVAIRWEMTPISPIESDISKFPPGQSQWALSDTEQQQTSHPASS